MRTTNSETRGRDDPVTDEIERYVQKARMVWARMVWARLIGEARGLERGSEIALSGFCG